MPSADRSRSAFRFFGPRVEEFTSRSHRAHCSLPRSLAAAAALTASRVVARVAQGRSNSANAGANCRVNNTLDRVGERLFLATHINFVRQRRGRVVCQVTMDLAVILGQPLVRIQELSVLRTGMATDRREHRKSVSSRAIASHGQVNDDCRRKGV